MPHPIRAARRRLAALAAEAAAERGAYVHLATVRHGARVVHAEIPHGGRPH